MLHDEQRRHLHRNPDDLQEAWWLTDYCPAGWITWITTTRIYDQHGNAAGPLSNAFRPPADMECISAKVSAIIRRRKDDSEPAHQHYSRSDQWEFVIPELIFSLAAAKTQIN